MRKRNKTQAKTLLDIIILAHNQSELLERCLSNIPAAVGEIPHSIFVLDNGSTKEESTKIRAITDGVATYVYSRENLGFPAGNNRLVRAGTSPLLLLLNSDVFMYPDSIRRMVMAIDDPTIGVVGAKLIFDPDSTDDGRPAGKVQHVGLSTNIKANFFHHLMGWSPDNPRVLRVRYPYAVTGACMLTRRSLYKQIGGLNEIYGRGCLVGNTLINTDKGIVELKELIPDNNEVLSKISIKVASEQGESAANLAYVNGKSETLKVKLMKDFSIQGTPNHRIRVMSKEGKVVWKQLDELSIGDYVGIRYGMNLFGTNHLEGDDAYLMGLYIAEGSHEKNGRITITSGDKEIGEFLSLGYSFYTNGGLHWRKQNKEFHDWMSRYVDFHGGAVKKEIPRFFLCADKSTQVEFLRGMFDGDGSAIKDGRVNYSTSSYKLARQLQSMLLNLGIVAGIYKRKSKLTSNLNYLLDFGSDSAKFYSIVGFRLDRKQERESMVRKRKSEVIPYQRKYISSLYGDFPLGSRNNKDFGTYSTNPSEGVRRDTIQLLVDYAFELGKNYSDDVLSHLGTILLYDCVWLKVKSIEDGGIHPTFDLHVPTINAYIANGFIAHNTYEDVEFCIQCRQLGYNIYLEQEAMGIHLVGATAIREHIFYPLAENYTSLKTRLGNKFEYTEWEIW